MSYKIEDLVGPGFIPVASPQKNEEPEPEHRSSILEMLQHKARIEEPVVVELPKEVPESLKNDFDAKPVVQMPTITKEKKVVERPKSFTELLKEDAEEQVSDDLPIEEPAEAVEEIPQLPEEPVLATAETVYEEPKHVEVKALPDIKALRREVFKEEEPVKKCNNEIDPIVKKAKNGLYITIIAAIGITIVALVIKGIQLLFSI